MFASFDDIARVHLYGSRARGDYRPDSDIDLAVEAPGMTFGDFLLLRAKIGDLPMIFKVDLVHLENLDKPAMREKIAAEAVSFYERSREKVI